MINFTILLQVIEEIKDCSNRVGMTAEVNGEFISLSYNGVQYIKIVPKMAENANAMDGCYLYIGEEKTNEEGTLNRAFFDTLSSLKKQIDSQLWEVVLKMIFTCSSSPQENLSAIYNISAQNHSEQYCPPLEVKPKNKGKKGSSVDEEFLVHIKEKLNLQALEDIGNKFYFDSTTNTAVLCLSSKSYSHSKKGPDFWFSYHPRQKDRMDSFETSYIAFCLTEEKEILIIPCAYLHEKLHLLHTTVKPDGAMYWHIRIDKYNKKYLFRVPNKGRDNIQEYAVTNSDKIDHEELHDTNNGGAVQFIKIKSSKFKTIKK